MYSPPPTSTLFPYTTLFRSFIHREKAHRRAILRRHIRNRRAISERKRCRAFAVILDEGAASLSRSEEHTSELQSLRHLVCRLLLEKKKKKFASRIIPSFRLS